MLSAGNTLSWDTVLTWYDHVLWHTCSLRIIDGGIEKKYPAFTPSMATDGFPSKAWSSAFSTPSGILEKLQFTPQK